MIILIKNWKIILLLISYAIIVFICWWLWARPVPLPEQVIKTITTVEFKASEITGEGTKVTINKNWIYVSTWMDSTYHGKMTQTVEIPRALVQWDNVLDIGAGMLISGVGSDTVSYIPFATVGYAYKRFGVDVYLGIDMRNQNGFKKGVTFGISGKYLLRW